jgi:hypothetical protein
VLYSSKLAWLCWFGGLGPRPSHTLLETQMRNHQIPILTGRPMSDGAEGEGWKGERQNSTL